MSSNKILYILSGTSIFTGTLIYIIFRNNVFFLHPFKPWFDNDYIIRLERNGFTDFLLFNLPDALWAISLLFFALAQRHKIILWIALLIAPLMEVLQNFQVLPGTFDYIDLGIYLFISTSFLIINTLIK